MFRLTDAVFTETSSSDDSHALKQTFVFIKAMLTSGDEIVCPDGGRPIMGNQSVALVIGAASSQVSVMVASMLQLLKVFFIQLIMSSEIQLKYLKMVQIRQTHHVAPLVKFLSTLPRFVASSSYLA